MCELDWDEPCEFWNEVDRKARKEHKCGGCHRAIKPGEIYTTHSSKFDGDINTAKMCADCKTDRGIFGKAHNGMIPFPDRIEETLVDCIADGDDDSEKMWKPMLRRLRARKKAA